MKPTHWWPSHLPEAPSSNTVTLRVVVQHIDLERDLPFANSLPQVPTVPETEPAKARRLKFSMNLPHGYQFVPHKLHRNRKLEMKAEPALWGVSMPSSVSIAVPNIHSLIFDSWILFLCVSTTFCVSFHLLMNTWMDSMSWPLGMAPHRACWFRYLLWCFHFFWM